MKDSVKATIQQWKSLAETEIVHELQLDNLKLRQENEKETFSARISQYFLSSLGANCTLSSAAEALKLNRDYLGRVCRKTTGKTYHQLAEDVQMACARTILRETDCLITDLSEYLGFHSPDYFTLVFRKYHGETPSEWRKKNTSVR